MKFIHLSDLHFHRDPKKNVLATDVLEIIRVRYPHHNLIVTGDITDDGHPEQYKNALNAFEAFIGNIFVVPGNHDFGAAGNFYSRERALRFDEMLSVPLQQGGTFQGDNTPVVNILEEDSDQVMLIGLDTNLETDHPFDFACGEVGQEQFTFLNGILGDLSHASKTKILFFHHHPFIHNNPFMELKDAKDLIRTVFSRIDVMLFGHKHVSNEWKNVSGVQLVLASDNSPGKDWAREINVERSTITVKDISIKPEKTKRRKSGRG